MTLALDLLSWLALLGGLFFLAVGGIGLLRLPDFYTRLHAAGITDTLGAGLILLGLCFQGGLDPDHHQTDSDPGLSVVHQPHRHACAGPRRPGGPGKFPTDVS